MLVYRILHKKYNDALFAPGLEGRWNSAGKKVLYCSESIPLAFMESMIRRQGIGFNQDYQITHIHIPDSAKIKEVETIGLIKGWNDSHDYSICQTIGDAWYNSNESLILKVPSAVLSVCYNYMLNALHPEYKKIKFIQLTPLMPDPRIDELLKKEK